MRARARARARVCSCVFVLLPNELGGIDFHLLVLGEMSLWWPPRFRAAVLPASALPGRPACTTSQPAPAPFVLPRCRRACSALLGRHMRTRSRRGWWRCRQGGWAHEWLATVGAPPPLTSSFIFVVIQVCSTAVAAAPSPACRWCWKRCGNSTRWDSRGGTAGLADGQAGRQSPRVPACCDVPGSSLHTWDAKNKAPTQPRSA